MKLLLVVNPISGGKSKEIFIKKAEEYCSKYGIPYEYFHTTGEDDIKKLAAAVESTSPDKVVSIGGDGTTLMTALALQNSDVPFGIIPMGSANGMAKELSVPNDTMQAFLDIIASQMIIPIDVIKVNDDYTMHLGDVGINAEMVENFEKEEGRGWAAYAKHFVSAVKNAELFDVTLEIDDKKYDHKVYSVLIANTRMYGTGAIVNPKGNPHDGKFEIVLLTKRDWTGVINLGLTAFDKRAVETFKDYTKNYTARSARIKFDKPRMLQLDGEVIGECESIEAEIIPGGVKYITTADNHFIDQLKSS